MFSLNVRTDTRAAVAYLNSVKKGIGDQALVSALNKTVTQAKTQISAGIRAEYNISASLVRERLSIQRARRSGQQFTATLVGNPAGRAKRAMNLIHFVERKVTLAEAKRRRKRGTLNGTFVKIKKAGGAKLLEGAFIGNQGRTVFKRVGKSRLPIVPAQTIGIPQMFNAKKIQIPVQRWITTNFPRIFDSEMKYYLSTVK